MVQDRTCRVRVWLVALALLTGLCVQPRAAWADEEQTLDELIAVLQNVANTPRNASTPEADARNFEMLRQGVPQLQAYVQRGDFVNARRIVRTWQRRTESDALQKLCQAVIGHLEKKLDETETPLVDRADDLIERATQACRTAQTAGEMDEIGDSLFEFRNFEMGNYNASRTLQRVRQRIDGAMRFVETYQQYLDALTNGDRRQAMQHLSQMTQSNYGYNMRLLSLSEIAERRRSLETALMEEATAALDRISETVAQDASLEAVQTLQSELDELYTTTMHGGSLNALRSRLERSRSSLQTWIGVLLAEANGDVHHALEQLRTMQESGYRDLQLIPPQVVVAKHQSLVARLDEERPAYDAQVTTLLEAVRTAADVQAVRLKLEALRLGATSSTGRQELALLAADLDRVMAMYRALEAGQYDQVWSESVVAEGRHRWLAQVTALRSAAVRKAIAATAGLDAFEPANAQETPAAGLLRLADAAAAAGQWRQTYRLLDVYAMAFARQSRPAWLTAELTGCQAYLAGRQLEEFGQHEEAAESYMTVLRQVGERIPRKEAAERLEAIGKR